MKFKSIHNPDSEMGKRALKDIQERNKEMCELILKSNTFIMVIAESEDKIEQSEMAWILKNSDDLNNLGIENIEFVVITHAMIEEIGLKKIEELIKNKDVALVDWD